MFATKVLVGAGIAAGMLAFAAVPAKAETRVSVGIGGSGYYTPAPYCPPVYSPPVYSPPVYSPPAYCPPVVVAPRPVYRPVCPPPVVYYDTYRPGFSLSFGWRDGHRHYRHHEYDRDRHHRR